MTIDFLTKFFKMESQFSPRKSSEQTTDTDFEDSQPVVTKSKQIFVYGEFGQYDSRPWIECFTANTGLVYALKKLPSDSKKRSFVL